jgi:hypothetical protein
MVVSLAEIGWRLKDERIMDAPIASDVKRVKLDVD